MNKLLKLTGIFLLFANLVVVNNLPSFASDNNYNLSESTEVSNKVGCSVRNVNVGESLTVDVSSTFVQVGQDDSALYMRFVTAVSGPIKSISYTRESENLGVRVEPVEVVYKGVSSNDQVLYYDGSSFVNEETEVTKNYYLACYTIQFNTNAYVDEKISAYISVETEEGETLYSQAYESSVNELLVSDEDPILTFVDDARLTDTYNGSYENLYVRPVGTTNNYYAGSELPAGSYTLRGVDLNSPSQLGSNEDIVITITIGGKLAETYSVKQLCIDAPGDNYFNWPDYYISRGYINFTLESPAPVVITFEKVVA